MIEVIQLVLKHQRKLGKSAHKIGGFTLIELLVAMILAALVITPLLGFMLNILNTDRQEQAKSSTEQELQSALNYISRDLQQAVYIYDGKGIDTIKNQLPGYTAASSRLTRVPILVFWKREYLAQAIAKDFNKYDPSNVDKIKCQTPGEGRECNDTFVYSLVVYYLIDDADKTWSDVARIARVEIKDGIRNPNQPVGDDGNPNYLSFPNKTAYNRDPGFKIFNLSDGTGSTIEAKMNSWTKSGEVFTNPLEVLIDYIDQTPTTNNPAPPSLSQVDCQKILGVKDEDLDPQVPGRKKENLKSPISDSINTLKTTSFYACVDTKSTLAYVYLRGNALARVKKTPTYTEDSVYFPSASITVKGRGFLFNE